jgi:hypothetical protein
MSLGLNHGSAKIYEFPAGGRAALGGRRYSDTSSSRQQRPSDINTAICSESWYHQAAIEEARGEREH